MSNELTIKDRMFNEIELTCRRMGVPLDDAQREYLRAQIDRDYPAIMGKLLHDMGRMAGKKDKADGTKA